jgi:hypothetical protein
MAAIALEIRSSIRVKPVDTNPFVLSNERSECIEGSWFDPASAKAPAGRYGLWLDFILSLSKGTTNGKNNLVIFMLLSPLA